MQNVLGNILRRMEVICMIKIGDQFRYYNNGWDYLVGVISHTVNNVELKVVGDDPFIDQIYFTVGINDIRRIK